MVLMTFSTRLAADEARGNQPIAPEDRAIRLFNGRDLGGLYTWLKDSKCEDPRKVFTIHDGILCISGDGLGYVATENEYKDYHLILEFKWGKPTWGMREHRTRDSGLFLHAVGPDGNYTDGQYQAEYPRSIDGGPSAGEFMTGIEAQIMEGCVGDVILIQGKDADGRLMPVSLTTELTRGNTWKKGGERTTLSTNAVVKWFAHDPAWKDVTGFRGKHDVESPYGQWTRMDVICDGGHIALRVNGTLVNEGFDTTPSAGKIAVQCELAEIFIRRWELRPLDKQPGERKRGT